MSRAPKAAPPDLASSEPARPETPPGPLCYRFNDLPTALGVSRRTIERERSAGRFPKPDLTIVKMPLWRVETIRAWIEGGGQQ
jgi:predicted DNA-binding transcriptional regulator AlpA